MAIVAVPASMLTAAYHMLRFPTAGHRVSWAGLCPRLHESDSSLGRKVQGDLRGGSKVARRERDPNDSSPMASGTLRKDRRDA